MNKARRKSRAKRSTVKLHDRSVQAPPLAPPPGTELSSARSIGMKNSSSLRLWVSLALIALNLAVYAPVWRYDFVDYDDRQYVTENLHVKTGLTWANMAWAFTRGYQSNWHPLTWLSHMVDVQLYGIRPGPHHLTNVLFHMLNTLLLFALLHRMTGALGRSAFVASLFAVHPLHVESVAWLAERKDVLSTLFWMLTLWAYLAYVSQHRQSRLPRYLIVLVVFALGLMAKPMLVTLPFLLLLLDLWPLGRIPLGADVSLLALTRRQWPAVLGLVLEKLPLLALVAASSIVTFVVQRQGGAVLSLDKLPFNDRAANAARSYLAYIGSMIWPTRLAVFYPFSGSLSPVWFGCTVLVLIGVTVAVTRAAKRHPYLFVGWLWYLGTLVPVIGLVQVGVQSKADRYTYIPLIGLFIIAAWGVSDLAGRWPSVRKALPIAAVCVILTCAITARAQVRQWQNSTTLWTHALDVTTGNFFAHVNLGYVLWGQGKSDNAIAHYEAALRINPNFPEARNNLGVALAGQGKFTDAITQFSEALRIKRNYAEAHNNIGAVLGNQGKLDEAMAHFSAAVRLDPNYVDAHKNLGIALARQGKLDEAMAQFSAAVRLDPDDASAHYRQALALQKQGRIKEAMHALREALRINPSYEEAQQELEALRRQSHD